MLVINATMLHDKLIQTVTSIEDPKITFKEKKGLELRFETEDDAKAAEKAKRALKAIPEFNTVYFQIHIR